MIDLCLFNHDARSWVEPQCQFKLAFTLNYKILSNFRFKIHLHWKLKLACHVWKHPQKEQIQDCQTQELLSQSIAKRLGLGKRGWQIVDSQMFRHFYVPKNGSKNMKLARYKKESMLYISGERYIFYTLFISLAFFVYETLQLT